MSFDLIAAVYVYCANYHSGQGSRLYALMSRIVRQYDPRISDNAWEAIADGKGRAREEWSYAHSLYMRLAARGD